MSVNASAVPGCSSSTPSLTPVMENLSYISVNDLEFGCDEDFDDAPDNFEWTSQRQICLLKNLFYLKPYGPNKHLNMLLISEAVSKELKLKVSTKHLWDYVNSKWNIDVLDEIASEMYEDEKEDFDVSKNYDSKLLNKVQKKVNKDLKKIM